MGLLVTGWTYAHRSAWKHEIFNSLLEAAVWNFLYQNAFWKDGQRNFNGHIVELKRGQIAISIRFLADGFEISEKRARTLVEKLEKSGMIGTQRAQTGTIITICNYDKYQVLLETGGTLEGKLGANKGHTEGANKKELNKLKKVNEDNNPLPPWMPVDAWKSFCKHRGAKFTENAKKLAIGKLDAWRLQGHDPKEILENSVMNGWQGLFKPKEEKNGNGKSQQVADVLDAAGEEWLRGRHLP